MSMAHVDWSAVLFRLEQTVVELKHANSLDISQNERRRRLAVAEAVAGQVFAARTTRVSEPFTKEMRALELLWEEGFNFNPECLSPILDSIADRWPASTVQATPPRSLGPLRTTVREHGRRDRALVSDGGA